MLIHVLFYQHFHSHWRICILIADAIYRISLHPYACRPVPVQPSLVVREVVAAIHFNDQSHGWNVDVGVEQLPRSLDGILADITYAQRIKYPAYRLLCWGGFGK